MINVWRDMEGKGHSLLEVVSQRNKKELIFWVSACLTGSCAQISNRALPRYELLVQTGGAYA
jgi:hypothetical protein